VQPQEENKKLNKLPTKISSHNGIEQELPNQYQKDHQNKTKDLQKPSAQKPR